MPGFNKASIKQYAALVSPASARFVIKLPMYHFETSKDGARLKADKIGRCDMLPQSGKMNCAAQLLREVIIGSDRTRPLVARRHVVCRFAHCDGIMGTWRMSVPLTEFARKMRIVEKAACKRNLAERRSGLG